MIAGNISLNVNPKPMAMAAPIPAAMLHENAETKIGIIVSPTPSCVSAIAKMTAYMITFTPVVTYLEPPYSCLISS